MGDLGGVCGDLEPLCGARYIMVLGCVSRPSRRRVLDLDSGKMCIVLKCLKVETDLTLSWSRLGLTLLVLALKTTGELGTLQLPSSGYSRPWLTATPSVRLSWLCMLT